MLPNKTVPQETMVQAQEIADENILVVHRHELFPHGSWQGLKSTIDSCWTPIVMEKKIFLPRSMAETNAAYKQIIPYMVFCYGTSVFLMQRTDSGKESRLHNKYSLGIGGHIRQEDMIDDNIASWARREFHEEVDYAGTCAIEHAGILNDDSNDVGKVHVGFVYLMRGNSPDIKVKSELKSGRLVTLSECQRYYADLEPWSQVVFDYLWTMEARQGFW